MSLSEGSATIYTQNAVRLQQNRKKNDDEDGDGNYEEDDVDEGDDGDDNEFMP